MFKNIIWLREISVNHDETIESVVEGCFQDTRKRNETVSLMKFDIYYMFLGTNGTSWAD